LTQETISGITWSILHTPRTSRTSGCVLLVSLAKDLEAQVRGRRTRGRIAMGDATHLRLWELIDLINMESPVENERSMRVRSLVT
jgi:hypothetical protein